MPLSSLGLQTGSLRVSQASANLSPNLTWIWGFDSVWSFHSGALHDPGLSRAMIWNPIRLTSDRMEQRQRPLWLLLLGTHSFHYVYILSHLHFILWIRFLKKKKRHYILVSVTAKNELVKKLVNFLTLHYIYWRIGSEVFAFISPNRHVCYFWIW